MPPIQAAVRVTTLDEALAAIGTDKVAVLPCGSWELAKLVLRAVGATELQVEDRLHVARTGRVLYAV